MKNKSLLISLGDKYYGFTPESILKELEKSQWWDPVELEALQIKELKSLLTNSAKHVPYYRRLFDNNKLKVTDFNSLDDLFKLPIVDKSIINNNKNDFISDNASSPKKWLKTTGSTGVPFSFIRTRLDQSYKIASRIRFRNWYGVGRLSKMITVGGIPPYNKAFASTICHKIHFISTRKKELFASEIQDEHVIGIINLINKYKPDAIMGYPSGISVLASKIERYNLLNHKPLAIFTNSETLQPYQKSQIIKTFEVIPRADYVATEGSVAHECPSGGLHVDMEGVIVEIVGQDDSGLGDVLLTCLHSLDFPLIRYKIGDRARWNQIKCECGRGLKMIDNLIGRSDDVIRLKNGREFSAANINMRIAHLPSINNIEQYQLVQNDPSTITLRIVKKEVFDNSAIEELKKSLSNIFKDATLNVEICSDLQRTSGGKIRTVIGIK